MDVKIIFLVFCVFLLAGCSYKANLKANLDNMEIPSKYSVDQYMYDSGFAGVGENSSNISFVVRKEAGEGFTLSDIRDRVWGFDFEDKSLGVGDGTCFLHEQWGVSAAVVCFDESLYYFHLKEFKGNHQVKELKWKISGKEFIENDGCAGERNIFCNVFLNALNVYVDVCDDVAVSQEYCKQLKMK